MRHGFNQGTANAKRESGVATPEQIDASAESAVVDDPPATSVTRYAINLSTGVAHIARPTNLYVRPVAAWGSVCGMFKFGIKLEAVRVTDSAPDEESLCRRCRSRFGNLSA